MNHTDTQLKQALAKMLPETLIFDDESSQHNTDRPQDEGWGLCWDSGNPVLDAELLHLCWLVEEKIEDLLPEYREVLCDICGQYQVIVHATWQQRTIALAKVKGIEIV